MLDHQGIFEVGGKESKIGHDKRDKYLLLPMEFIIARVLQT